MKKTFFLLYILLLFISARAQQTPYEVSKGTQTSTWQESISYYKKLDAAYTKIKLLSYGQTDIGKPLHLVVISANKIFDPSELKKQDKRIILINNGIHPGEPEGVDASMMLARDLIINKTLPDNVLVCIIPIYNVDGSLNRGNYSRANQNGPVSYGFRGNYQNLDLNRDFIKTDSKNSFAFQQIFNTWNPDIFVDTHVSNGADYQYVMTLIATQKNKLQPVLADYMTKQLEPFLYTEMKNSKFEMTPYVDHLAETPDSGIVGFLETPRYATGYTTLHNTIGFITETHMLKSFAQRQASTYRFLELIIAKLAKDAVLIKAAKLNADEAIKRQKNFAVNWKLNMDSVKYIDFKGYEAKRKPSEISGQPRLYYDRSQPYTKKIPYYNLFDAALIIEKPTAYLIPQSWSKVIELLKLNRVQMKRLSHDTLINVEMYYIDDYKTVPRPYEGHYIHSAVKVSKEKAPVRFYEGDYVVYTNQVKNRYIIETLEPQAVDSYFAWNFFDAVLGQKEHFSAYVFEDLAAELLKKDPELKKQLATAIAADEQLAKSGSAQLDWVYRHSPYYEKTYRRYPVARLIDNINLDLK